VPFAILVEFEKEEDAKEFAHHLINTGSMSMSRIVQMPDGVGSLVYSTLKGLKLRGAWRIPSKFCNPADGHRKSGKIQGWSRGKKYGWWVCTDCGKPTEKWGTGGNWDYALGSNLIPQEITGEQRMRGWHQSPMQWNELLEGRDNGDQSTAPD
jgi:hypothetical protein